MPRSSWWSFRQVVVVEEKRADKHSRPGPKFVITSALNLGRLLWWGRRDTTGNTCFTQMSEFFHKKIMTDHIIKFAELIHSSRSSYKRSHKSLTFNGKFVYKRKTICWKHVKTESYWKHVLTRVSKVYNQPRSSFPTRTLFSDSHSPWFNIEYLSIKLLTSG